jgi:hypothetical protein
MTPPAAIAILDPLSVEDLQDMVIALTSTMVGMDLDLDLRAVPRSKLITMVWVLAITGPSFRIGDDVGRRRLPDHEALEKLARLAACY